MAASRRSACKPRDKFLSVPFAWIFSFPKSPDRFPLKLSNRILKRGNISMNFSCPSIYISGETHLYLSRNEIYRPGTTASSSMNTYLIPTARLISVNANNNRFLIFTPYGGRTGKPNASSAITLVSVSPFVSALRDGSELRTKTNCLWNKINC